MSPERGQRPWWPADGRVPTGRHGVTVDARAWHLGRLILAAGRGPRPAPVVTTGGTASAAGAPVVAVRLRLPT